MATGPPNLGDNRFAILANSSSPKRKKSKHKDTYQFQQFPQLPKCQPPNPKYIVMETNDSNKPLSSYSCFAVHRAIQIISKDITSISQLRDGSLLLLVNNKQTADKFLNSKELFGLCKIKCKLHENLNCTKGTIYAPYLNDIPDEEIISELSDQGVVGVHKFQKLVENKPTNTGVLLLTFDLYHLPDKIKISWNSVNVREYYPNPMRCKTCQKLGHTKKHCKNPPICEQCNLPPHIPLACTRLQCANCLEEHAASSNKCSQFTQQKELLKIKIKNKCTMSEAKRIQRNSIPITPNTKSYSSVTSEKAINKQKPSENNNVNKETNENKNNNNNTSTESDVVPSTSSSLPPLPSNTITQKKLTTTLKTSEHTAQQKPQNSNDNEPSLVDKLNAIINKSKTTNLNRTDVMDCEAIITSEEE